MRRNGRSVRFISVILIFSMLLSLVACSSKPTESTKFTLSDPNNETFVENIEVEDTLVENILHEHITEEIYLNEIVVAENQITELLLEEETISEVLLCQSIYVSEDSIDEFAEHSQTAALFGDNVDWSALLKKLAVGTGVIVTLVILKKAGLPEPICSVVVGAADKALKFAEGGAAIGALYGASTGAAGEIDKSGRTEAVIGFAIAVAGLVLSIVSLVAEIPSGGSSNITLATGVKLVIAGIATISSAIATVKQGYDCVKTFTATDTTEIDWDRIDWDKVGCAAAEQSIENAADGYMWGAVIGAVYGGAEGYEYYHKYSTPYSTYLNRLAQTPAEGKRGHWTGTRGESDFVLDEPIELPGGEKITKITYKNAVPDFSQYAVAEVDIPQMSNIRKTNFSKADSILAEFWTKIKYDGQKKWTASDVRAFREENNLTWHEMNNMKSMQLVPYEVNNQFTHLGGVGEYNAMIGIEGVEGYD